MKALAFAVPAIGADWTEEQWAAHDAKIAAERESQERADREAALARIDWVARGYSIRAVEAARAAKADTAAMIAVARWAAQADGIAILSGPPGTGKTVAATWFAMRADAEFVRASAFATSSRYEETRERWRRARAMVLDDLGAEYADAKGSFAADLDDLIDCHYASRSRLLITTNMTHQEFSARYGERVNDRLRECGRWLSVGGASMRRKP